MSVSEKQTVEIVKVLYRGADILILDEPTAVLTPQETQTGSLPCCARMRADGKAIVIITHKLHEVLALSDRVAVLRKGGVCRHRSDTRPPAEAELTELMVGKKVGTEYCPQPCRAIREDRLEVEHVSADQHGGRAGAFRTMLRLRREPARFWESPALRAAASGSCWRPLPGCSILSERHHYSTGIPKPVRMQTICGDKTPTQIRELGVRLSLCARRPAGYGLSGEHGPGGQHDAPQLPEGQDRRFSSRKKPQVVSRAKSWSSLEVVTPGINTPGAADFREEMCRRCWLGREIAAFPH